MAKVIISPYSARLRNNPINPKNWHLWPELVAKLIANGHEIVQVGVAGEEPIEGSSERISGWPWAKLKDVVNNADTWVSVDNAWPHFCHCERLKSGVVIWGKSSPRIFGYPENENIIGGEQHFRPFQFQWWEEEPYDPSVFPDVMQVLWAVERKLKQAKPVRVGIY